MTATRSAIYEGRVRHRRWTPVEHAFDYRLFMMYLNLAELDELFRTRWLWSSRRPALAWFRRRDHLGDPAQPLVEAVGDLVAERTGRRPAGPITLLTHLRYFGWAMNPVSFYYCFDAAGDTVEAIVAEVHNTPWGEQHCYVLPSSENEGTPERMRFRFPKAFHVSPFMGMNHAYDWRFAPPGSVLPVTMVNRTDGQAIFDATMTLRRRPVTGMNLARVLVRHPFMTARVSAAIYWQAARLWRKRCPFHPHPRHGLPPEVST
ncbi:MAG: DUF1365 domain-containing protein [Phycisphaerales bacterium]|nr:DUF1365 domain-containing protein [Phycisphaerae bacterium]NNF41692.1 DUF1365 domain-containing protein [Phycisphaerales bacterium]NNM26172.1 DUF1365 domain-containing protein [Phycisphaerales bacterium]